MFPGEQLRLSRRWAEPRFSKLVHFNELDHGGHFAALEQPKLFVDEVRSTFKSLRRAASHKLDGTPIAAIQPCRICETSLLRM